MDNFKKLEKMDNTKRLLQTARPKASPYQKAEQIMLNFKPCTIVLRNGSHIAVDLITKTSVCLAGIHTGYIYVSAFGKEGTICLDDVKDILE